MEITQQCVVALTWTLKDTLGEELDVLDEPVEFLLGGNDLLPRIEEALQGHSAGAKLSLHLEPEDAFGDFNDQLLFLEPRHDYQRYQPEGGRHRQWRCGCQLPTGQDRQRDLRRQVRPSGAEQYREWSRISDH
jgi:FKBP-type peptidyl-prolyl cis-trans isomerase 2